MIFWIKLDHQLVTIVCGKVFCSFPISYCQFEEFINYPLDSPLPRLSYIREAQLIVSLAEKEQLIIREMMLPRPLHNSWNKKRGTAIGSSFL
ncbi:hypothetical protein AB1K32_00615 [Metabacillus dongyingensis]|uniref:hypothetical protein n=1 Tax=Metabacillus dongyingensis TaxID=2874282 RepID=UPI003B8AAE34